jgi:hypothetical protein
MSEDDVSSALSLIGSAAKQSDRWWFFALLMIGMGYVGWERMESRRESDALRKEIIEVRDAQLAFMRDKTETITAALVNNTRALEANTAVLNRFEFRKNE